MARQNVHQQSIALLSTFCTLSVTSTQSKRSKVCFQQRATQARSKVLRLWGQNTSLGSMIFVFIICLKQILLGTKKIGGKRPPNAPPCLRAWCNDRLLFFSDPHDLSGRLPKWENIGASCRIYCKFVCYDCGLVAIALIEK